MPIKRIIPVSSGKGGVGKTTFAVNFSLALAQHGRTVLIDLDTGTSSIRNAIDVSIPRDLYHFFKKADPLASCVTPLDGRLDPDGRFRNFGFVAAPLHLIEEITNFNAERKRHLVEAINGLDTDFVVLDLKAGLDSNVLDFLPFSNSGILIFTPQLPAATLAASDIVKSILFRKLRLVFGKESPFFESTGGHIDQWRLINELIDRVEDVYEASVPNLDAFASDLYESLGEHPLTTTVRRTIEEFRVHYVLNLFNGVENSFDTAVRPFIENLTSTVSSRCGITNLGWVTRSESIHRANCARVPALLWREEAKKSTHGDRYVQELEDLRVTAIGMEPPRPRKQPPAHLRYQPLDPQDHLSSQLGALRAMFEQRKDDDYRANFDYITQRALFTMKTRRPSEFGDVRIYEPQQMLAQVFARSTRM